MVAIKELREAFRFACSVEFWRMGLLWTSALVFSYFRLFLRALLFHQKYKSYARCSPITEAVTKPICIITGATSGLGAAAASDLSREGFYVVLAGRSSHLLSETISEIEKRNKGAKLKAFHLDLSSFHSIMKFKIALQRWLLESDLHCSVQLLINNAGILATSCRYTSGGYEQMMGTNYIGAFFLTKALQPLLENSPIPSRIVNVTSFTHWNVSEDKVNKESVSGKSISKLKHYPCAHIYEYSKFCLLLFTYELHRQYDALERLNQISVIAADPGVVETNLMREVPACLSHIAFLVLRILGLLQSPERGVSSILDAALSPPEVSGVQFFGGNGRTLNSSGLSYNTKLSTELWKTSCDLFIEAQLLSEDTSI